MPNRQSVVLGLGGGCHWCTEAIFSSIYGINDVRQGWLASKPPADSFSEGILLDIDTQIISLREILQIHIETHSSDNNHSKRDQYRSAVYTQNEQDRIRVLDIMESLARMPKRKIITQVLPLNQFKMQPREGYIDYYYKRPDKPFCQAYINPKLKRLLERHGKHIKASKLAVIKRNIA
jgi:peptide-methionine (S)-S-oxide reductase